MLRLRRRWYDGENYHINHFSVSHYQQCWYILTEIYHSSWKRMVSSETVQKSCLPKTAKLFYLKKEIYKNHQNLQWILSQKFFFQINAHQICEDQCKTRKWIDKKVSSFVPSQPRVAPLFDCQTLSDCQTFRCLRASRCLGRKSNENKTTFRCLEEIDSQERNI